MFSVDQDNFWVAVQHALNQPIRTRCAELAMLLDRSSLLELHHLFPQLIDHIFGPLGTVCWDLRSCTSNSGEDVKELYHFFSPCGPLFKLIYTLLRDPNIKYEFPVSYLPSKIKQIIEHPLGHPFYSELVNMNPQTRQITLLLNPFDYYFFHFAYHLINPLQQRSGSMVTSWNTVYYGLCCHYILHFLPTDPCTKILPEFYYNGKNRNKHISPPSSAHNSPRNIGPPGLVSPIVFKKTIEDNTTVNLDRQQPCNDIWRSETVLTVFVDMWLYNDSVSQKINNSDLNNSYNKPVSMRLRYNELPTGEYMRIVRVLIKQLHSFSDSAKCDDTNMSELKKVTIPMIQGKFYVFLRNLIHRWPLDGSFRLVLELWLTYIQPWRYPAVNIIKKINPTYVNPDVEDVALNCDKQNLHPTKEHLNFIAENLLCYVVIFEQLLPRFGRVDLVSPKISLMLYRITKVFDQQNLPQFLREIEQYVENHQQSPTHQKYIGWQNSLPTVSPNINWSTTLPASRISRNNRNGNVTFMNSTIGPADRKWTVITKQKILEFEGPNFCYKPLFSQPPAHEVFELMLQIKKSSRLAYNLIKMKQQEQNELYSGFWGSIKYFLQSPMSNDEFSLEERKKVPMYLEASMGNLRDMFDITEEISEDEAETTMISNGNGFEISQDFKFLTPDKVRTRLKTIKYDGDPDLLPIRSDECAFLVRMLYQLALYINENFGDKFYYFYHNPSFWGRLCRQILCPPMTVHKYDKSVIGSPRINVNLPPRISLRYFASYQFLGYVLFGALIAWTLNYCIDIYLFTLLMLFILYKFIRAIPNTGSSMRHSYPTEGFGNISFNDSF
ncbi:hypothetical protein GWI33_009070 [Rhynchophorus ferrugineus]|uniref:Sphingomyelin phosphodiesterase 4 n=1 Tax=Rhynchophorus ferrugineus TaxID=354439 RepID=A0A834IBG9_RHYFE|nr:hypothetical protein GWI33_009070 [Rhynchophorus ferrugineus]